MNKKLKSAVSLCFAVLLFFTMPFSSIAVPQENGSVQSGEIPYKSYTYWVDYNTSEKTAVYSKPMYKVSSIISAVDLGAESDSRIVDVATDSGGSSYILDSENSAVYILDGNYELTGVINSLNYNGETMTFVGARGIYVDKEGYIYIADTENERVVITDRSGNVKRLLLSPNSDLIPTDFKYRPVKLAVDSEGYTYIACDGSYYGAILYSPEMEFLGFFGANTVKTGIAGTLKNLWDRLTSNDIKRAADEISLPYTFNDIVVGADDFVYTTTGITGDESIQTGQICILNPGGKEVLGESDKNFADYSVGYHELSRLTQNLSSIDVDANGFIYALDSTYGRVFWYDSRCELFSVFGGSSGQGDQQGTFANASALAVNGSDVLIADAIKNSITVFKITEYGELVRSGRITTLSGDYAAAKDNWEKAVKEDTNCQMAYRGLGMAFLDSGEYREAMKYAKIGADRETYADAYENIRTEILEENFIWIFLGIIFLIGLVAAFAVYKKKHQIILIKNEKFGTVMTLMAHPVENFRLVKENGQGSVLISAVLLIALYAATVLNDTHGGFAFTVFDNEEYNALYVFFSTVGLAVLWIVSNWLVCLLVGGTGELKEIFIVTSYCTLPITLAKIIRLILTHILVPDEAAFLNIFMAVCTLYALFMLIVGIMKIHDFEFGKFVGTAVFSVVGMLIIVFLLFLIFMLAQQVFTWLKTIFIEIIYR